MALFENPNQESGLFNFGVDEEAKGYLLDTARWSKFLAVVGFVSLGILLLAGVFMSTILASFSRQMGGGSGINSGSGFSGLMIGLYVLLAVLYFFPIYYLFKFSVMIKPALLSANQAQFNKALSYLRGAFRYIGILTLIVLCFYAIAFLIAMVGFAIA